MDKQKKVEKALELYTIGHSNRSLDVFLALLKAHGIEKIIDVRTIPKSRHNPQFNADDLKQALKRDKIAYQHLKGLGGLRHAKKDSINTGWINASFRGYADYMQTEDFETALARLKKIAMKKRCAILCAEAVPWRCHRSLIADALSTQKWKVLHIQSKKTAKRHKRTSFLRIKKGKLTYP